MVKMMNNKGVYSVVEKLRKVLVRAPRLLGLGAVAGIIGLVSGAFSI
jgi:hypothetical protein